MSYIDSEQMETREPPLHTLSAAERANKFKEELAKAEARIKAEQEAEERRNVQKLAEEYDDLPRWLNLAFKTMVEHGKTDFHFDFQQDKNGRWMVCVVDPDFRTDDKNITWHTLLPWETIQKRILEVFPEPQFQAVCLRDGTVYVCLL